MKNIEQLRLNSWAVNVQAHLVVLAKLISTHQRNT